MSISPMLRIKIFLIAFMLSQVLTSGPINYQDLFKQGNTGSIPTCYNGSLQSPQNLDTSNSYYNGSVSIVSDKYENTSVTFNDISATQQYISFKTSDTKNTLIFNRYGYLSQYYLVEIRIRIKSEHQLNGEVHDLELQLIHKRQYKQKYDPSDNIFITDANKYLGISILYSTDPNKAPKNDPNLEFLANFTLNAAIYKQSPVMPFENLEVVSADKDFYIYEGSDTIPPNCDEFFNWVVYREVNNVNSNLYDTLTKYYAQSFVSGNNRPIPLIANEVPFFRNFKTSEGESKTWDPVVPYYIQNDSSILKLNTIIALIISFIYFMI